MKRLRSMLRLLYHWHPANAVRFQRTFGFLRILRLWTLSRISLFVRPAQAIFRPRKVLFPCPQCGLQRHDPDAVYCEACGTVPNIPDDGD